MFFERTVRRCALLAALALPLAAAAFPTQPVEWVVPYAAGGGSDVVARVIATEMTKALGQTIIINNKPGAGTNIGAAYAARATSCSPPTPQRSPPTLSCTASLATMRKRISRRSA
jgi:tripartite-type tricarboxylate transporter receptor subunit TctC